METVQTALTSGAIVVGGVWTYFKFIKGRTFRPRVNGQWHWLGTNPDSAADGAAMRYFCDVWQLLPAFDAVL
jgi:hypothetical protein